MRNQDQKAKNNKKLQIIADAYKKETTQSMDLKDIEKLAWTLIMNAEAKKAFTSLLCDLN